MGTSAYQQSVSSHRCRGTDSDQLSKLTLAGDPRHRNKVVQPPPSAATDAGDPAVAQNASLPGVPDSPNRAAKAACSVTLRMNVSL